MNRQQAKDALSTIESLIYDNQKPDYDKINEILSKVGKIVEYQANILNMDRMIELKELEKICGFKESKIYEMIKNGELPEPKKYGRSSRWKLSEIQAWVAKQ